MTGNELRSRRDACGISRRELCEAMGYTKQSKVIYMLEGYGPRTFGPKHAARVAHGFDVIAAGGGGTICHMAIVEANGTILASVCGIGPEYAEKFHVWRAAPIRCPDCLDIAKGFLASLDLEIL